MADMNLEGVEAFEAAAEELIDDVDADDTVRIVGTNVAYAPPVEYGSAPHVITGDPLAFPGDDGETAFATRVEHPGTDPQPHVRPGARATKGELADIALTADSLEEFLDRAAVTMLGEIQRRAPVDSGTLRASYGVL